MKSLCTTNNEAAMARRLAPEDIRAGQYVSVLNITIELMPTIVESDANWQQVVPQRVSLLPWDCEPARVIDVCLPFVLVKQTDGEHETIDVRRQTLARVSSRFGREVFDRAKSDRKKKKRKDGDDDDDD